MRTITINSLLFLILFSLSLMDHVCGQSPIPDNAVLEKIATGFQFTEGPCWRTAGYLVFSDIQGNTIYKWTEEDGATVFHKPSGKANGLVEDLSGRLLLAQHENRSLSRLESDGTVTAVVTHYNGKRLNSPNDIAVKSDGSIYFTDPPYGISESEKELDVNGVYVLPPGSTNPILVVDDLDRPNGLGFSPDESRLYVCDTNASRVFVYDVDSDGMLSNGREFVELSNGNPDGMTLDQHGNVYIACSDDGLNIFSPGGELLDHIDVPERTRNVTFGGADQSTLYITAGKSVYRMVLKKQEASSQNLPDTGQTGDYTSTFGEDSDYIIHPPAFSDNGDGTINDDVTGLMWQKIDGGEMTWEEAQVYADNLSLGNHNDWRLPTPFELFNLLDLDHLNPAMDTNYFPETEAEYWWTSTPRADDSSRIWVTNAGGGIGPHPKSETVSAGGDKKYHVRCVRGAGDLMDDRFVDNQDGTVTDKLTNLQWQQSETLPKTWEDALSYCENLVLAGLHDWRLPNIKELRSISLETHVNPSVDVRFFPGAVSAQYWSSTTQFNKSENAWFVDFRYGLTSYENKTTLLRVRAVRSGDATQIDSHALKTPEQFRVFPNYPNPFNPDTRIAFTLPQNEHVRLVIYDVLGKKVRSLVDKFLPQGEHSVLWDGRDSHGSRVPSGVYVYELVSAQGRLTGKAVVMR